jgi:hypothetical protein
MGVLTSAEDRGATGNLEVNGAGRFGLVAAASGSVRAAAMREARR